MADGMGGIAAPIGAGATIEWEGRQYLVPAITLQDYGVFSNRLKQIRRERIIANAKALAEGESIELAKALLIDARHDADKLPEPTIAEVEQWGESATEGLPFVLWHQLEKKYPGQFDEAKIRDVLQKQLDDRVEAATKFALEQAKGAGQPGESLPRDGATEAGAAASEATTN